MIHAASTCFPALNGEALGVAEVAETFQGKGGKFKHSKWEGWATNLKLIIVLTYNISQFELFIIGIYLFKLLFLLW